MAACIADHGGLSGKRGKIKLQFLVRARGRAEGVGVLSSTGVTDEAAACIVERLKNRMVGAPSADPVGVTVTLQLKAP
jgi:outer membrane biosynthesis protein TonB